MRYILIAAAFVGAIISVKSISAQQAATCVEWGEAQPSPDFGMNTQLLRDHVEENCMQPDWAPWRYDWNSAELKRDVADLKPTILRFPGGTGSNYWCWENETRQIIGDDGNMRSLDMCEATLIGVAQSLEIGCNGANLDLTADRYEAIYKKTTVTLESYKNAVQHFRDEENLNVQEMFVISLMDPFYYLGGPHLEAITAGANPEVIIDTMVNNAVRRAETQLDKILDVYCNGCPAVDDAFSFELGNEYYLQRYGKFFPSPECFGMSNVCIDCLPDINMYADISEQVIPMIRTRFPNAKIAMCGGRDVGQAPWNEVIIERFGSGEITVDAAVMHFYPRSMPADSINVNVCKGILGSFDPDRVMHEQQKTLRDLFDQKRVDLFENSGLEIWVTEFNNYFYFDDCELLYPSSLDEDDFAFDSGNWIHALSIMNLFNEFIAFRSDADDPWMNSSKNIDLTKLCVQVMLGKNGVAAIRDDRKLSAQGMAAETLMHLTNTSTSITRLLIGPEDHFTFDALGNWQAAAGLQEPVPYLFDYQFTDELGTLTSAPTWDVYGFKFESDQGPRVLIVNLKSEPLSLDMSHVESFSQGAHCLNRSVDADKLHQTLLQEHGSSQIHYEIGDVSSSAVNIPAYSICVLDGIAFTPNGLEDEYALSEEDIELFPNPALDRLTVKLNASKEQVVFRVIDVTGQILIVNKGQGLETSFNLQALQNGMYFMEVQAGEQRQMKPFVIQR